MRSDRLCQRPGTNLDRVPLRFPTKNQLFRRRDFFSEKHQIRLCFYNKTRPLKYLGRLANRSDAKSVTGATKMRDFLRAVDFRNFFFENVALAQRIRPVLKSMIPGVQKDNEL